MYWKHYSWRTTANRKYGTSLQPATKLGKVETLFLPLLYLITLAFYYGLTYLLSILVEEYDAAREYCLNCKKLIEGTVEDARRERAPEEEIDGYIEQINLVEELFKSVEGLEGSFEIEEERDEDEAMD